MCNLLKVATSAITHLAVDLHLQKQSKYGGHNKWSQYNLPQSKKNPVYLIVLNLQLIYLFVKCLSNNYSVSFVATALKMCHYIEHLRVAKQHL